mmetsp:Transcript_22683/g.37256  ORF Transcript_22683/g.37256 Transcript_22683/m.37256 type:complete len:263 (-) Transcript_22683:335-1123(-)
MIAPMPTAPIGAASPICPTTPTSTAPKMGTVALDKTMGSAILRTRRCVNGTVGVPGGALVILPPLRHHEMPRGLRKELVPIVLPALHMHRGIAPPGPDHPRPCIGIPWQAGPQIVDREIHCFGQARQARPLGRIKVQTAILDLLPQIRPTQGNHGRHLKKGRRDPTMQCRQQRIADQLFVKRQHAGQFIAAPVKTHAQILNIGHAANQGSQRIIAPLFHNLDRFRTFHRLPSTVKAPVAVATGLSTSSSVAVARTKATERVT